MIRIRIVSCLLIVLMLAAPALPAVAISDVCPGNNGGAHEFDSDSHLCRFCGEPCPHNNPVTQDINITYTDDEPVNSDGYHIKHWQHDAVVCGDCGYVVDPGKSWWMSDDHSFSNGQCSACGHRCTHPEYSVAPSECVYCGTPCPHTNYDITTHKCVACGTPCPHDYYDTTTHECKACQFPCPHTEYDTTTHQCKACGFPCDHPTGSIRERKKLVEYVAGAGKEKTHDAVYVKEKYCSACGAVTETGTDKTTESESHSFVSGVCEACLYACQHADYDTNHQCKYCKTPCPHTEYDATTHECKACGFPCPHAAYDATTHKCKTCQFPCPHVEYDATTYTCKACGLLCDHAVSSYRNINYTHTDDYTYDQNERHTMRWQNHAYVCDTCGFVIDPGEAQSLAVFHIYSHGQCEECGHVCTHSGYVDYICDYCKTPCPHDAYNETTHQCTVCGFPCPHPDEKIKSAQSDPRYDVISTGGAYDSSVHIKSWTPFDCCDQCGMEVAYEEEFVFEAHAFGADGYCTRCGFGCAHDRFIRVKNAGGGYDVTCETCGMVCAHTDKTKKTDIRYTPASGDAHSKSVKIVRSCALCRYVTSIEETETSEAHVFQPDIAGRNRCALCRQYEDAPLDGDGTFLPNASMVFADGAETVATETGDAFSRLRVDVGACEDEYQFAVYELPEEWKGRALLVQPPEGECVIAASDEYLYIARKGGDAISFYISFDAAAERHGYQPVGDAPIGDDVIMNGVFATR